MISTCFLSCSNTGVSKEDLQNHFQYLELEGHQYSNDIIKDYVDEVVSSIIVFNQIPIVKPTLKYRLKFEGDIVNGIVTFRDDRIIQINKSSNLTAPVINIQINLNEDGVYDLNYEHSYKGKLVESIQLVRNQILQLKFNEETTDYKLFDNEGNFQEIGYFKNNSQIRDTTYIDKLSVLNGILRDSIELMIKNK